MHLPPSIIIIVSIYSAKETIDYLAILLNIVDFSEKEKEALTSKVKNLMKKGPSSTKSGGFFTKLI
jgi:hypothetical protein